jgi:hypothetical protein
LSGSLVSRLARHPAPLAVGGAALITWLLCTMSPVRAMSTDTLAGTLGGVVYRCGGGYDLRNIEWIARGAAHGRYPYFAQPDADGHVISPYGPLPNLMGSLAMHDLDGGDVVSLDALRRRAKLVASLLLALCAGLLAWAGRPSERPWRSAAVALVAASSFAGCPTLGQALWQQTISTVPLVAGFALLIRRDDHPRLATLVPGLLLVAVLIRPTIGPLAVGLGVAWAIATGRDGRRWAIAGAAAAVLAAPLVWWNLQHLGTPLPLGQWRSNTSNTTGSVFILTWRQLAEGVAGLLVSPARGLLWFAPIVVVGVVRALRDRATRIVGGAMVAQLLFMALFYMWWGGYCFGPRFLTEVTWLATWAALATPVTGRAWRVTVAAAATATVVVGQLGLWRFPMAWEAMRKVDDHHDALWQLEDSVIPALITDRYGDVILSEGPRGQYRVCMGTRLEFLPEPPP